MMMLCMCSLVWCAGKYLTYCYCYLAVLRRSIAPRVRRPATLRDGHDLACCKCPPACSSTSCTRVKPEDVGVERQARRNLKVR